MKFFNLMEIVKRKVNEKESLEILTSFDSMFSPYLSTSVELPEYSKKLAQKANWILCVDNGKLVGYIAYYENRDKAFDYITSICVLDECKGKGIASRMLDYLIESDKEVISCIQLLCRKNNEKALRYYYKHGFVEEEDLDDKYLLKKVL